jgi:signal transduction histidine kinase
MTLILSLVAIQTQALVQLRLFSDPEIRLTGTRWLSEQTAYIVEQIQAKAIQLRPRAVEALATETGLHLTWSRSPPASDADESTSPLAARLAATLSEKLASNATQIRVAASILNHRFQLNLVKVNIEPASIRSQLGTGPVGPNEPEVLALAGTRIWVEMRDRTWLGVELIGFHEGNPHGHLPFAPLLAGGITIALVSTFMARRLVAPLDRLVKAADQVGSARDPVQVDTHGLHEFASVAKAFEDMQRRLLRFVDDRTQILAAISHDLRSSLTRLRLAAEPLVKGDEKSALLAEIADMQSMIESTLAFASGEARIAPNQSTDVAALLISLADEECDAGRRCTYDGPNHVEAMAHPTSLKRAFRNVVDNAIKYGTSAHIGLSVEPDALVVNVDDEGPGIPIDRKEDAFAPFRRLDPARGQNVPGAGLGLTIARDVVQSHGGTIDLLNRDGGGFSVRISLPRR